jgi:hypothetical protein
MNNIFKKISKGRERKKNDEKAMVMVRNKEQSVKAEVPTPLLRSE